MTCPRRVQAVTAAGPGGWRAIGGSGLFGRDLDAIIREATGSAVGDEAIAGEMRYVDRSASVAYCMDVAFDTRKSRAPEALR